MHGTDRYLNSFFPDAMKSWNNVITDFNELPTFEELKKHLISLYRPDIKPTFGIHNPKLRYIFQLRVGLSHLLPHKKVIISLIHLLISAYAKKVSKTPSIF